MAATSRSRSRGPQEQNDDIEQQADQAPQRLVEGQLHQAGREQRHHQRKRDAETATPETVFRELCVEPTQPVVVPAVLANARGQVWQQVANGECNDDGDQGGSHVSILRCDAAICGTCGIVKVQPRADHVAGDGDGR